MKESKEQAVEPLSKLTLIGIGIFALLFYVSVYFMISPTHKELFAIGFGFMGFIIPFTPVFIKEKYSTALSIVAYVILSIPIVLWIIFLIKYAIIANHNYVIPKANKILFTISTDWKLLENEGVGEQWTKFENVTADLQDRLSKNEKKYHLASIGSDIVVVLNVKENDPEDDEDWGFDLDPDESASNQVCFPATFNIGKKQVAKATVTTYEFNHSEDDGTRKAVWECTLILKRKFDFWEVLFADLDYYNIDWKLTYSPKVIGQEKEFWRDIQSDDGSVQHFPISYYDYIYETYDNVEMEWMESSAISEVGYSEDFSYLLVRFLESDSLYCYLNVPRDVYEGFFDTDSPGRYFNEEIRDNYDYMELE